jgi:hypothetical protein
MMANACRSRRFFAVSALYDNLLQAALRQFFGRATFETEAIPSLSSDGRLAIEPTSDPSELTIRWFGSRHVLHVPARRPFTAHEVRLARAIGAVLSIRYRAVFDPQQMLERGELFRGAIEDRYVGAFVDAMAYRPAQTRADLVADRASKCCASRRCRATRTADLVGVLILDTDEIRHLPRATATQAFRYHAGAHRHQDVLPSVRRPRDGLPDQPRGSCWTCSTSPRYRRRPRRAVPDAVPSHALATAGNRNVCVVLSPSHEIKLFAEGVQVFSFRNARWHLLDLKAKYELWAASVGNRTLAERLFQTGGRPRRCP